MMLKITLIFAKMVFISSIIHACPDGQNERVEPLGPCKFTEPKCQPNAYCYPEKWLGPQSFQWVCCPNTTALLPSPPAPPLFPQPPVPPSSPWNTKPSYQKSKGVSITIPLNDAARQQLPFAVMNLVQEQVQKYPVLIFSLSTCQWCKRAKELFDDFYPNVAYYYFDYDLNQDGNPVANAAMGVSGMTTVPMIYICQQLIGGFTDLQNLHVAHELEPKLQKCITI